MGCAKCRNASFLGFFEGGKSAAAPARRLVSLPQRGRLTKGGVQARASSNALDKPHGDSQWRPQNSAKARKSASDRSAPGAGDMVADARHRSANARVSEGNLQSAKEGARGNLGSLGAFFWFVFCRGAENEHKNP